MKINEVISKWDGKARFKGYTVDVTGQQVVIPDKYSDLETIERSVIDEFGFMNPGRPNTLSAFERRTITLYRQRAAAWNEVFDRYRAAVDAGEDAKARDLSRLMERI